jgi:hypothetical protein
VHSWVKRPYWGMRGRRSLSVYGPDLEMGWAGGSTGVASMKSFGGSASSVRVPAALAALAAWLMLAPAATADSVDVAYFNGLTAHGDFPAVRSWCS